jgi:endogenous inhibitor of DNA gyrase (YacG/DUF329 family)
MPEFVTCPACGVRVQMAEGLIGRNVRCLACEHRFVAAADPPRPEVPRPPRPAAVADDSEPLPFCPGCGRQIPWEVLRCPFCDEELEPETSFSRPPRRRDWPPQRLDCLPHRGKLIVTLGNVSLALGGLSLCTLGIAALVSVPLGVIAWVLASHDLEEMRAGRMDPQGKTATETGRTGGIMGAVLGLVFGAFFAVVYLASF